ncbi:MAG TPA: hypothetical protein VF041_17945 [Gemmatimonadaceae bacterium]
MSLYPLLVFLHVLGAVGMFAAWGIEAIALSQLRRAVTVEQARTAMGLSRGAVPVGPAGMLVALVTGLWMMGVRWGLRPWMVAALAALVLIVVVGIVVARRAVPPLTAALGRESDPLAGSVRVTSGPLVASLQFRVAMGIAILALMTVKPGGLGSLAIMAAAVVTGLGLRFAARGEPRVPA